MNMDRDADLFLWFGQLFFHRIRMKSMQSSEKNVPTWPSKPSATAAESRKPVGTACNYKATNN